MKNIFLTGEINIGKTTVINSIIQKLNLDKRQITGFYTLPYLSGKKPKGFYIEPTNYLLFRTYS
jgi:nucleoside-triphosphatase